MIAGLAGKSCAGKNLIAEILQDRGWDAVDMDRMSHEVLEGLSEEAAVLFGDAILTDSRKVDRKALGQIVFSDPEKLKDLENLIYPVLHDRLDDYLKNRKTGQPLLINAAALEKSDFWKICDLVLWVDAPWPVRLLRARKRDKKPYRQLVQRFRAQGKLKPQYFFKRVDIYIIKNGGSRKRLEKSIDKWLLEPSSGVR